MNRKMVHYVIGRILIVVALMMTPSLLIALIYKEGIKGLTPFYSP